MNRTRPCWRRSGTSGWAEAGAAGRAGGIPMTTTTRNVEEEGAGLAVEDLPLAVRCDRGLRGLLRRAESLPGRRQRRLAERRRADRPVRRPREPDLRGQEPDDHVPLPTSATRTRSTAGASRPAGWRSATTGQSDASHARKTVEAYPVGKAVTVYYMPDDPREAVLEKGLHFKTFFLPDVRRGFLLRRGRDHDRRVPALRLEQEGGPRRRRPTRRLRRRRPDDDLLDAPRFGEDVEKR